MTAPTRHGVFLDGKLILLGKVPDRATADAIKAKAAAVLGPENVIDHYEIDPTVPVSKDGHVRIENRILFAFDSAELQPGHEQVLDLAAKALELNPQARAVITGHTDSTGPDEVNQPLSEARAASVAEYLVAKGVDPNCVTAVGKAATEPVADNATADGRRLNRRIEVEFTNLLG